MFFHLKTKLMFLNSEMVFQFQFSNFYAKDHLPFVQLFCNFIIKF